MTLNSNAARQLYIPPGFAHGFYVISETAEMTYLLAYTYHLQGEDDKAEQAEDRAGEIVSRLRSDDSFENSPSEIELLVLQHVFSGDIGSAAIALRHALDAGWTNYYWYWPKRHCSPRP